MLIGTNAERNQYARSLVHPAAKKWQCEHKSMQSLKVHRMQEPQVA